MSERETLRHILPYIPPYWVRQAFGDPERTLVGREARLHAAVLFVDISGFTPISEALSQKGREGIEELSALLDRYFSVMAEPVMALGGEIVKFAGDSLIVLFPVQPDGGDAYLGAALHCALRMQKAVSEFAQVSTSAGTFPLRMKIGIGEGAVYTTTVGDEEKGMQPVFAGRPLVRCMQAEDQANADEIVTDAALVNRIPGRLDIGEPRGTFRLILGASDMPTLPPIHQVDSSAIDDEHVPNLIRRLAPYLPGQVVERIRQRQPGLLGEYRRVTVMFAKLGDLSYDLEPSIGRILQVYFTTMRDCILRHGGWLNEVDVTADGATLVVFFGAPTAHEDDELRAVACAWEMQQAIADVRLETGTGAERLRQSIGISSGRLFVGEVGAPVRRTYTAVGDEMNLASRLMNRAHWGEVVVTSWVEKNAASRFEFRAMGEVLLKGKSEPVPLFALVARPQERVRNELLSIMTDRHQIIGREAELKVLDRVRDRVWQGHPHLLLVTGEAGVGKTRLVSELAREWIQRGGVVYAADCRRYERTTPYGVWSDLLRVVFGIQVADSPERRREKIQSQLAILAHSSSDQGGLIADLLDVNSFASAASYLAQFEEQRVRFHRAIWDLIRSAVQRLPVLLLLESFHDVDDASLALLNDLLANALSVPLLVCAVYRPREDLRLAGDAIGVSRLVVETLSEADSLQLARLLLEAADLPGDLAPQVVEQAKGNPFYMQETVGALVRVDNPAMALAERMVIPDSVSDVVQAQMDPLGEDLKLTLRLAAVIGPSFSFGVLQAAHPLPVSESDLVHRLTRLERMQVIRLDRADEDMVFRFQHAMTRRVLYASLLTTDRERMHGQVGLALESVYGDNLEPHYEPLADHFYRADFLSKAVSYAIQAGWHAARGRAFGKALSHYLWAEEILCAHGAAADLRCIQGVRLQLLLSRGAAHDSLGEVVDAAADYEQAARLAGELADLEIQGSALRRMAEIALHQAEYPKAQVLVRQAMQRFSALDSRDAMADLLLLSSQLRALQGHLEAAQRAGQQALTTRSGVQDPGGEARCESWMGAIYLATGRHSQALDALHRAAVLGQRATDQGSVTASQLLLAQVLLHTGRWGEALRLCREADGLRRQSGSRLDVAEAQRVLALVLNRIGAYDEAREQAEQTIDVFTGARYRAELGLALCTVGEALLGLGRAQQAAEHLQQALALGQETYTAGVVVQAQLGLGQVACAGQDWSGAQRLYTEARARARSASLDPLIVEARLGLARAYLGCREWERARREASQALDASYRLQCPHDTFRAAAILSQTLIQAGQAERAITYLRGAHAAVRRLAVTLPPDYARRFLERPDVRVLNIRTPEQTYTVAV